MTTTPETASAGERSGHLGIELTDRDPLALGSYFVSTSLCQRRNSPAVVAYQLDDVTPSEILNEDCCST